MGKFLTTFTKSRSCTSSFHANTCAAERYITGNCRKISIKMGIGACLRWHALFMPVWMPNGKLVRCKLCRL